MTGGSAGWRAEIVREHGGEVHVGSPCKPPAAQAVVMDLQEARRAQDPEVVVKARPLDAETISDFACAEFRVAEDAKDPQAEFVAKGGRELDQAPWWGRRIVVEGVVSH
jgi:hypothetical protein